MFILQVFYPLSVVIIAVGMICYVMDFMLVMMHFNITIMIQSKYDEWKTCSHIWQYPPPSLGTADCGPGVKWRQQSESKTQAGCKMQNKDCRLGVKYRPNINCSRDGFKGKINPANTCKRSRTCLWCAFTNPFLCSLERSSMTRKHNCSLQPFFCPRDLTLQL